MSAATPPAAAPRSWLDRAFRAVDLLLAALLLGMVVMVFGNVVLRYAFNAGILVSEELSRYFFVWLTFIGAVSVMRDNGHLGMDMLVAHLGPRGRRVALVVSELIVLACCVMLAWGTWRQHDINATTAAPITGLALSWVFGVAYVTAIGIGLLCLRTLWRLATGRLGDDELVRLSPHGETDT